ncbi:MAG: hypothetical protein ACREIV_11470, partial [Planctomycetaceae bacterium]
MQLRSKLVAASTAAALVAAGAVAFVTTAGAKRQSCRAPKKMSFDKPKYIDESRAGGEPTIEQHPDGTLLYGSHAGSTHFYAPAGADPTTAAFVENYTGQAYYYFSKDNG